MTRRRGRWVRLKGLPALLLVLALATSALLADCGRPTHAAAGFTPETDVLAAPRHGIAAVSDPPSGGVTAMHTGGDGVATGAAGAVPGGARVATEIDTASAADGFVTVRCAAPAGRKLKALVTGPTAQYRYDLLPGVSAVLPLSQGDGTYMVRVCKRIRGDTYAVVASRAVRVKLCDACAPFLHANLYVDYEGAPRAVAKAKTLCAGRTDPLAKVEAIYGYIVGHIDYDRWRAAHVESGYTPDLDEILRRKKGICLDYAALMAGMLRSQGIPCKLVVGYAGDAYHAWVSVWMDGTGWIGDAIRVRHRGWMRMDPTYAATGLQSREIMRYIGDDGNYRACYEY